MRRNFFRMAMTSDKRRLGFQASIIFVPSNLNKKPRHGFFNGLQDKQ
jgi:hypothetical protein